MELETVANIAWCLMGAVMVGSAVTYGCMHRLIDPGHEDD